MHPHFHRHKKKYATGTGAIVFFLGLITSVLFSSTIAPNTEILRLDVGGLSKEQARTHVEGKVQKIAKKKILVRIEGKTYQFSPEELGIQLNTQETVADAYMQTHSTSVWSNVKTSVLSLVEKRDIPLHVKVDQKKLQNTLIEKTTELDDPEKVAAKFFQGNTVRTKGIGGTTDYRKLAAALQNNLSELSDEPIDVEVLPKREYTEEEHKKAVSEEEALRNATITLRALTPVGEKTWTIHLKDRPAWIERKETKDGITVGLNSGSVRAFLNTAVVRQVRVQPKNAIIKALPETGKMYATVSGVAHDGALLDLDLAVKKIVENVRAGNFDITLPLRITPGEIINETGLPLGRMELIAEGRSNFAGSPEGRDFNIRKALKEKFNNILIVPGERFDYNSFLGPVTKKYGWKDALAIFGGGGLRKVPGGGLCQVSTTVYRAAVFSGLPIVKRKPHSLYVHYYTAYGEGLDSTIYPGGPNLIFENDTGQYLLIQAYDRGNDAFIRIYGTSDGRKVRLAGPYRWREVTPELLRGGKKGSNPKDIVWFQEITQSDGTVEYKQIVSSYKKPIPSKRPKGAELVQAEWPST